MVNIRTYIWSFAKAFHICNFDLLLGLSVLLVYNLVSILLVYNLVMYTLLVNHNIILLYYLPNL